MIQRYTVTGGGFASQVEDADGAFVKYVDHEAECQRVREEFEADLDAYQASDRIKTENLEVRAGKLKHAREVIQNLLYVSERASPALIDYDRILESARQFLKEPV